MHTLPLTRPPLSRATRSASLSSKYSEPRSHGFLEYDALEPVTGSVERLLVVFLRLAAHVAALRYHLRSGFLVTAALIIQRNCAVHSLSSAPQNNKGFVNLKPFQAGAQENMVKSNTPACMQAPLRYKGCIAPGELCCSASCRFSFFPSPLCLSQISFRCCRCTQGWQTHSSLSHLNSLISTHS